MIDLYQRNQKHLLKFVNTRLGRAWFGIRLPMSKVIHEVGATFVRYDGHVEGDQWIETTMFWAEGATKLNRAYAGVTFSPHTGTGYSRSYTTNSWATCRSPGSGVGGDTSTATGVLNPDIRWLTGPKYLNTRSFLPINLTGLSGTVTAATLNLWSDHGSAWISTGSKDKLALVLTTQASVTALAFATDYAAMTINTPAEGCTRFAPSNRTDVPAWLPGIALNATGLSWITGASVKFGIRTAYYDVDNNAPTTGAGVDGGYMTIHGQNGANPPTLVVTTASAVNANFLAFMR